MPFSNYSQLQTAVAGWLHRIDLVAQIPDFITLAESRINRRFNLRNMEIEAPLVMVPGSRYVALPADFGTPIALWLNYTQPREKLTPALPENFSVNTDANGNCQPNYWAIDGDNIAFPNNADQAYPLIFRYMQGLKLSTAFPTNKFLTNYPDAYLYATLLESAPYIQDMGKIAIWQDRFNTAEREITADDNRNKSISSMTTELGSRQWNRGRFNINRGW